jgi:hypothetical protein
MRPRKLLLCICVLAVLLGPRRWMLGEMRIDRCLDCGGRWNAIQKACEGANE